MANSGIKCDHFACYHEDGSLFNQKAKGLHACSLHKAANSLFSALVAALGVLKDISEKADGAPEWTAGGRYIKTYELVRTALQKVDASYSDPGNDRENRLRYLEVVKTESMSGSPG